MGPRSVPGETSRLTDAGAEQPRQGTPGEVLLAFLKLGLTELRRSRCTYRLFSSGLRRAAAIGSTKTRSPTSSLSASFFLGRPAAKVVFSLGLMRGGWLGGLAASAGFTLPSAITMLLFAYASKDMSGPLAEGVLHGLKLVAVAIVSQAVWGMAFSLCPDRTRAGIALVALILVTVTGVAVGQVDRDRVLGGCAGAMLCRADPGELRRTTSTDPRLRTVGMLLIGTFAVLLVVPPLLLAGLFWNQTLALFEAFYRSGALVFGGGHVVLPLLRDAVVAPGWVAPDVFLAGYGAAQAMPGPLFTFAAYLGAVAEPAPNGIVGAVYRAGGDLSAGIVVGCRPAAVFGTRSAAARQRKRRCAEQYRSRRVPRGGALQPGLDQRGHRSSRLRDRRGWFRFVDGVAVAAVGGHRHTVDKTKPTAAIANQRGPVAALVQTGL